MKAAAPRRRARPLLGTLVEIAADRAEAIDAAFAAIARVQALMSYHDPASELSRLNREAATRAVRVSPWTAEVLQLALRVAAESGGVFDPTVAPRLCALGFLPATPGAPRADRRATWRDVQADGDRVRFRRALRLDLGGIAKGFAVDRAVESLQAAGVASGVVNAGGDLRVFGSEIQRVHLRDPASPGTFPQTLALRDAALATSAAYFSRKRWRGAPVCALLDGRSRAPGDIATSASVVAPTAALADAFTKVALFAPPETRRTLFARHQATAHFLGAAPGAA
jgi:thiamine biosynthesis lipoprotein